VPGKAAETQCGAIAGQCSLMLQSSKGRASFTLLKKHDYLGSSNDR
jgi:hypothetical protein